MPASEPPDASAYAAQEPVFDAELRAITADVVLPVGERATEHVFAEYTAREPSLAADVDAIHATERRGSGWLVVPVKEPAAWTGSDRQHLVESLGALHSTDYRRAADLIRSVVTLYRYTDDRSGDTRYRLTTDRLSRFLVDTEPYYVR